MRKCCNNCLNLITSNGASGTYMSCNITLDKPGDSECRDYIYCDNWEKKKEKKIIKLKRYTYKSGGGIMQSLWTTDSASDLLLKEVYLTEDKEFEVEQ